MLRPVAVDNAAAVRFGDGLSLLARPGQGTAAVSLTTSTINRPC